MNNDSSNLWTDHRSNDIEELSPPLLSNNNEDRTALQSSCRILVRLWHFFDGIVLGVLLCWYGWSIPIVMARVIFLLLGTIRIVRYGLMSITPMTTLTVAWCLACTGIYILLALVSIAMESKIIHYIQLHKSELHIQSNTGLFLDHHTHTIWILLLIAAVLELVLAYTGIHQIRNLPPSTLQEPLLLQTTPGNPPWANHTQSNQPMTISQDGIERPTIRNRRLFSHWFTTPSLPTDLRDDGSVDFSSVQDEWASRSEEDPFWWTKTTEGATSTNESTSLGW